MLKNIRNQRGEGEEGLIFGLPIWVIVVLVMMRPCSGGSDDTESRSPDPDISKPLTDAPTTSYVNGENREPTPEEVAQLISELPDSFTIVQEGDPLPVDILMQDTYGLVRVGSGVLSENEYKSNVKKQRKELGKKYNKIKNGGKEEKENEEE